MAAPELEARIRSFVRKTLGMDAARLTLETDIVDDLRIYGDDVWDLVEAFGKEFQVDVSAFRWYHHTGPEGCNPLWLIFKPWWARKTHVSIRLSDLVESVQQQRWSIVYPENERVA
jgi:Protein of unknown function (DUF1493)